MKTGEAKVTFIIPAYNASAFLERTVKSVRQQSLADWRMIIIDDCSTDNTLSVAHTLAASDPRIKVVAMNKPSGGGYHPRIKGILLAETEFVAPLDADDRIDPDYLQNLLLELEQKGAEIIYPTLYIEQPGKSVKRHTPSENSEVYTAAIKGKECVKYTLDGWRIGCGGGIIRRSTYLKAVDEMGKIENNPYADELHSRLMLLNADKVAFSEQPYYYFVNPESVTHAFSMGKFKLIANNIELCLLAHDEFGTDSEEFLLAQRQNFHTIFDLLRYIKKNPLSKAQKREAFYKLSLARSIVNWNKIKGEVSERLYWALRLLPLRIISKIR